MAEPSTAAMSNCAAPHPPYKAEHELTPQKSSETVSVKQEPQGLTNTTNPTGIQQIQLQQKPPPHFISVVTELRDLSTVLSIFQRRYDELQEHLDFIRTAIDSNWPEHLDVEPLPSQRFTIVPLTETPASDTTHLDAGPSSSQRFPIVSRTDTPASDSEHLHAGPSPPQRLAIVPPTETPASDNEHLHAGPSSPQRLAIVPPTEIPTSHTEHLDGGPSPPQIVISTETPASNTEHLDARPSPPRLAIVPPTETPASDTARVHVHESANSEQKTGNKDSSRSELEYLCEMMCSRGLRKYMVSHLSNIANLRKEVTEALKLARKPATLVFQCLGRFYLQGRKAYTKDSPMITARQASVLVLECFLLMGCNDVQVEPSVKEEADLTAVAWRKRLVSEGGLSNACEIDARGLLFFIGCFGIPLSFKNEDVRDLFRPSNARKISDVLRRSNHLITRIPEVIEDMIKNKIEVDAVDIAYTFGLEDRFSPQPILTSFLRESKEAWKKTRKAAEGSSTVVNEANKKHLADLKSVIKCLKDQKIDPLKLLPGWKINEKISSLEKDIADCKERLGENVMPKRKADETESSKKLTTQDVKRLRYTGQEPQQQRVFGYADGKGPYDNLAPMNFLDDGIPSHHFLDGGIPGHANTYSASPSVLHGYGAGLLPGNIIDSLAGSRSAVIAAGVGMPTSTGADLPPGSIAGVHGGVLVDKVGQVMYHEVHPYGWHGDAALHERLIGHSYAGQPAPTAVSDLYRPSSSLSLEGYAGQPAPTAFSDLYRPSSSLSLEGFAGLPSHSSIGVSNRSSGSDLYQFADTVMESESYRSSSSRPGITVPPVVPAHRSSYLY